MASKTPKGTKKTACMIEGCGNPEARRGLCEGCYRSAYRKIKEGKTTWPQLEKDGLAKPLAHTGTAFHRQFSRR
jgi:hypothetical protein